MLNPYVCPECKTESIPTFYTIVGVHETDNAISIAYHAWIGLGTDRRALQLTLEKGINVDDGGLSKRIPKDWTSAEIEEQVRLAIARLVEYDKTVTEKEQTATEHELVGRTGAVI